MKLLIFTAVLLFSAPVAAQTENMTATITTRSWVQITEDGTCLYSTGEPCDNGLIIREEMVRENQTQETREVSYEPRDTSRDD